jgi:hypothetical protein
MLPTYELNDKFVINGVQLSMLLLEAEHSDAAEEVAAIIIGNKLTGKRARTEAEIREGLASLKRIQPEDVVPPFDIRLGAEIGSEKHEGERREFFARVTFNAEEFMRTIEKLVRSVEICTLKWVLDEGGGLNTEAWAYTTEEKK